jgi:transposase
MANAVRRCYAGDSRIGRGVIPSRSAKEGGPMRRYGLRDDQWDRIKIFCVAAKAMWEALPRIIGCLSKLSSIDLEQDVLGEPYPCGLAIGRRSTNQFRRWAKSGIFERIFKLLAEDHDNKYMMIDAHNCARSQAQRPCAKKTERKPSADPSAGQAPKSKCSDNSRHPAQGRPCESQPRARSAGERRLWWRGCCGRDSRSRAHHSPARTWCRCRCPIWARTANR